MEWVIGLVGFIIIVLSAEAILYTRKKKKRNKKEKWIKWL